MRLLVTGLPRSGTSATANLLSRATGMSLLDDPEEVMAIGEMTPTTEWLTDLWEILDGSDIVKAPRLSEVLTQLQGIRSDFMTVILVRDPRDVYCSVMEKVRTGRRTTMLDNDRFLPLSKAPHDGVAAAAAFYHREQVRSYKLNPTQTLIMNYQHLAVAPDLEIERLSQLLGYDFNSLTVDDLLRQWGPMEAKFENVIVGPGRWTRELSRSVADRIFSIAGPDYLEASSFCICSLCELGGGGHGDS